MSECVCKQTKKRISELEAENLSLMGIVNRQAEAMSFMLRYVPKEAQAEIVDCKVDFTLREVGL